MIINKKKLADEEKGIITNARDPQYQGSVSNGPRSISFYDSPPHDVIGIFEFQSIAVSRLQVLKKI